MAIYHLRTHTISRGKGQSAVAAAAYRHCARMEVEQHGRVADYSNKPGNVHSEFRVPSDAPAWAKDLEAMDSPHEAAEAFWNKVELFEKRPDAQYAHEFELALPVELSQDDNIELVRSFVDDQFLSRGMAADWSYHDAPTNPHVHLMVGLRPLTEEGFGPKRVPVMDTSGEPVRKIPDRPGQQGQIVYRHFAGFKDRLPEIRQAWAVHQNEHLRQAGHDVQVDHRSYADRGILIEPTTHRGPAAHEMAARGQSSERLDEYEQSKRRSFEQLASNPLMVLDLVTQEKAVFDERDIARVIHRYATTREEFDGLFLRVGALEELVTVSQEIRDPISNKLIEREKQTTRDMLTMEMGMINQTREMARDRSFGSSKRELEKSLERVETTNGFSLSNEQRLVVDYATSDPAVGTIVGYAGAGKSTVMSAVRELYEGQGRRVVGGALAGKAAQSLEDSSGIHSRTLASWRMSWENGNHQLEKGDVFVLDEAGMVSSREMANLVDTVSDAGAKLVLVGDARQLQPIEAGAAFRAIAEKTGYVELTEVRRQYEPWMSQASIAFGRGETGEALQSYIDQGAFVHSEDRPSARAELIDKWHGDWKAGTNTLILAHTNADVRALNASARDMIQSDGGLREELPFDTARGQRHFAVGDRVLFLENNRDLGVKNGMLGSVEEAGEGLLSVELDAGRRVTVDQAHYGNIDYGYAATIHKSQGATVDRVHVLATPMMDAQLAYVSMTRHRESVTLYAGKDDFDDHTSLIKALSRDRLKSTTLAYEQSPDYRVAAEEFASRRGLLDLSELRGVWREAVQSMRDRFTRVADRFRFIGERLSLIDRRPAPAPEVATPSVPTEPSIQLPEMTPAISQALERLAEVYRHAGRHDVKRAMWFKSADTELSYMSSAGELVDFNEKIAEIIPSAKIRAAGSELHPGKADELLSGLPASARNFFEENWTGIHAGQMATFDKSKLDLARTLATDRREERIEAEYEAEQARYRSPDKPLIPGISEWPSSIEDVSRARVFTSENVVRMQKETEHALGRVWREPGKLIAEIEQVVDQKGNQPSALVTNMKDSPDKIAPMLGSTSMFGRNDAERQAALSALPIAISTARHYSGLLQRALPNRISAEKEWREKMKEPIEDLSPAASELMATVVKADAMPKESAERLEVERAALSDKSALVEIRSVAKQLSDRFVDSRGGIDKGRIADALAGYPEEEIEKLYARTTNILYTANRAQAVEQQIEHSQRIEREMGHDRSLGLE